MKKLKYLKLFEEHISYEEFGLSDEENIARAHKALKDANIEYENSAENHGFTFFIFSDKSTLEKGIEAVEKVIDKTKEDEWY